MVVFLPRTVWYARSNAVQRTQHVGVRTFICMYVHLQPEEILAPIEISSRQSSNSSLGQPPGCNPGGKGGNEISFCMGGVVYVHSRRSIPCTDQAGPTDVTTPYSVSFCAADGETACHGAVSRALKNYSSLIEEHGRDRSWTHVCGRESPEHEARPERVKSGS